MARQNALFAPAVYHSCVLYDETVQKIDIHKKSRESPRGFNFYLVLRL